MARNGAMDSREPLTLEIFPTSLGSTCLDKREEQITWAAPWNMSMNGTEIDRTKMSPYYFYLLNGLFNQGSDVTNKGCGAKTSFFETSIL